MNITVTYIPSTFVGHYESMTDVFDGAYGDEDYECYEYEYLGLVWEAIK